MSAQDWAGVLDLVASGGARVAISTASGGVAVLICAQELEDLQTSSAAGPLSTANVVLTPREQVVLARIAAGRSTAEIAAELDLSASTVTAHLVTARRKYGVSTSVAAARAAQRPRTSLDH